MSAYVPIRELAGVALPTGSPEGIFVMLRAYFDDSGSHADSDVVVVGGLIGNVAQWNEFESKWSALLAEPLPGKPPLKSFHLSACNAQDKEFSDYSDAECDAITHDFRQILIQTQVISTASAIDKKAWDQLVVGQVRIWLGDAIDVCVENCLSEAFKIAGAHPDGDMVAAVFDRGIWTPRLEEVTKGYTLQMGTPRIVSVNFVRVEDVLPLQGADISATENYWHAIQVMRDGIGAQPRAHMRHFLQNMLAEGLMIDRARIVEMLPEIEGQLQALRGQLS